MKNKKLKSKALLSLLSFLTLSTPTFAQNLAGEGGHSGNGGDPYETFEITTDSGERLPSWYMIKKDLIDGLEKDFHLSLDFSKTKFHPDTFKAKLLESLKSAKVYWDDQIIIVDGTPRPCENYKVENQLYIHCNRDDYVNSLKKLNAEAQYKFEVHEYASGAGLEPNHYGVSDYTFSSQISNQLETVTTKRWGKSENNNILLSFLIKLENRIHFGKIKNSNQIKYRFTHIISDSQMTWLKADEVKLSEIIKVYVEACSKENDSLYTFEIEAEMYFLLTELNPTLKTLSGNKFHKLLYSSTLLEVLNYKNNRK